MRVFIRKVIICDGLPYMYSVVESLILQQPAIRCSPKQKERTIAG